MEFQTNPYLVWQVIPGIILLGIGLYIQSRPVKKRESGVFSLMMFGGALWAFANAIQLITPDLGWQRVWNRLTYLGIMILPTTWFLLSVKLTGFQREQIERLERFFWLPPVLLYIVLLTSGWHRLFFTSSNLTAVGGYVSLENHYGILFYFHTVYSYVLLVTGIVLLTISLVTKFKKYGIQAYGLIIGVLAPLAGNAYFLFGSPPAGFPDPTPIIFTVTGLAFTWAIFGGRIFEVVPLAHESIVRKLATGVLILDTNQNIRDINEAAREMLGLTARTYVGDPLSTLVENHPEIALLVDETRNTRIHKDRKVQVAFPATRRTFDLRISHIGDHTDNTTGWLIQFNDISAEKLAEQNMIATQQTMKIILNTLQDSFFEADPNGIITYANKAFIKHVGLTNWDEVQGKNFRNFVTRSSVRDVFGKFKLLYQTKQPLEPFEYQYRSRDGSISIGQMTVSPIMEGDRVIGSRGSIRDVTARIHAEKEILRQKELLDNLLQQSPIAMVINDMDKKIAVVNPAFEKLFGYSQAEAIGKSLDDLISPFMGDKRENDLSTLVMKRQTIHEKRRRRKDGTLVDVELLTTPFFIGGERFGYLAFYNDISERVKAEELLKRAKVSAEARAGELSAINRVAEQVGQSLDLKEILQAVCKELVTIFEIRNAGIGLLTPDRKQLEIVAFQAANPQEPSALGLFLPVEGNTSSMEVIKNKKTVVIQDAQSDPRTSSIADISRQRGTKSIMIVPLMARGEVIGTIGMPAKDPGYIFAENEIELAQTIASQIASAVDNAKMHAKTELALDVAERDLEIGRQIQSGFFPERLPDIPGWEVAVHFQAARQVAGDFYDVFKFRNSNLTAFIIADVCDKGVGAALFMVLFRSLLRAFSETQVHKDNVREQLLNIINNTNNFIAEYHGKSNMFATLFFGILDSESGDLHYVNAGHEPPVILDRAGKVTQRLMPTGPAVGIFPNMVFRVEEVCFEEGDLIVAFTDGTTDAKNTSGVQFSEDRLLESIAHTWTSIFSMLFELNVELKNHIGIQNQFDDITLIAFRHAAASDHVHHAICRRAHLSMLGDLRSFVESAAVQSGLNPSDVFAFKLATDELCANIILYGYEGREPGLLSLAFDVGGETSRLIIRDDGKHFSPDQTQRPDLEADWSERQIGGLGIYFVKELMDQVTYNRTPDGVNQFILEKKISLGKTN